MAARGLVRAPRSARLVRLLVSAPIVVTAQYTAMQKREPLQILCFDYLVLMNTIAKCSPELHAQFCWI